MKTLTASVISGALLLTGTVLFPTGAVALDICDGVPATVVPDTQGHLVGTPGPDVIVAHGGQQVEAGDGDDLICLVGTDDGIRADAGPGDDTVDATKSRLFSVVTLGLGEDTLTGGPGEDDVWGAGTDGDGAADTERDVISTRGGPDKVFSGSVGAPNLDQIGTGQGDDRIDVTGLDHTVGLDVGSGTNQAIVTLTAEESTAWHFDVGRRTMTFDEVTSTWKGQLHRWYFRLTDAQAPSRVVFLGTRTSETVFVSGPGLVPHYRLGGGDDRGGSLTTGGGTFFLGSGRDRLTLGKYDSVAVRFPIDDLRVDLGAHQASFGEQGESPVRGVEILEAGADRVRAYGSGRGDRITANGCDVVVRGRAGPDVLTRGQEVVSICGDLDSQVYGGPGTDLLFGSNRTDDLLVGGPGFDRARGMRGTDTCRAEVVRGCELR